MVSPATGLTMLASASMGGATTPKPAATDTTSATSSGAPGWAGHATGACQGAASLLSGIGSICSMVYQGRIAAINHQIKKDTIENTREVASIEKEGMIEGLKSESLHNARMAELGKKALDAKEELYKAKGEESEIDHETKENKITEKMAATGEDKRMKMYFRNSPSYGSPDERYS